MVDWDAWLVEISEDKITEDHLHDKSWLFWEENDYNTYKSFLAENVHTKRMYFAVETAAWVDVRKHEQEELKKTRNYYPIMFDNLPPEMQRKWKRDVL